MKIIGSMYYPLGIAFEILEGPFVDSRYFVYYIPIDNNKTRVTVVWDFKSNIIPDDKIKPIVLGFSERVVNEDVAYLKQWYRRKIISSCIFNVRNWYLPLIGNFIHHISVLYCFPYTIWCTFKKADISLISWYYFFIL